MMLAHGLVHIDLGGRNSELTQTRREVRSDKISAILIMFLVAVWVTVES